jgi:SAM-dependent methyltransferase
MTDVRRRRSLTNVGGAVDTSGDAEAARALAHAFDVAPDEREDAPDRAHVHGFHTYPARTHPVTARRLVEAFAPERGVVLDPFCGSGTVLVEAMLAGRDAIGVDLNPLAVMLARAKTYPRPKAKTEGLVLAAKAVAAFADERRKARAGATRRFPHADVAVFEPHVLLELDSIRAGIAKKAPPEHRPELSLVLSSILVKVSRKKGDTSEERGDVPKRIAAGYPARLFVKRAEDLARRFDDLAALLPSPAPRARVFEGDAASLDKVNDASVDTVITSPPYVATYDYLAHHDLRLRWLGLDERAFAAKELGARRRYEGLSPAEAKRAWEAELERLFASLARVTKKGASIVLLIADSATAPGPRGEPARALRADAIVAEVALRARSLATVARASQARPHFHAPTASAFREQARAEHLLLLRRA